jgi:hypothetical protein
LKKNTDIGQIVSSKLENKYNDDFFDESKGWDKLVGKLPKKGFWDWGFTHLNIYNVTLSLLLLAMLSYWAYNRKENQNITTVPSTDGRVEVKALKHQEKSTVIEKNESAYMPPQKHEKENQNAPDIIEAPIPVDSIHVSEQLSRAPNVPSVLPNQKEATAPSEHNLPPKESNHTENAQEHPKTNTEIKKNIKDSITIAQPAQKKDTIRRRIKRFD